MQTFEYIMQIFKCCFIRSACFGDFVSYNKRHHVSDMNPKKLAALLSKSIAEATWKPINSFDDAADCSVSKYVASN